MKRIKIVDFFSIASFHEVFNTSLVAICAQFTDKVVYKLPRGYYNTIKDSSANFDNFIRSKIELKKINTIESRSKKGAFLRHLIGFWICIYEFLIIKKNELLIFNYTNYFSLPIILFFNRFLHKKVIFTMHGELELIEENPKWYKASRIFKSIIDLSLKKLFRKSGAYILVLGDSIRDNLDKAYPGIKDNIISICHPTLNDLYNSQQKPLTLHASATKLVIGTVGVMNANKGLDNLIYLASKLKNEISSNLIEIRSIGKVEGIKPEEYPLITWIGANKSLPRKEFIRNIDELDFILYLYSNQYKYCASGAILDSLACRKPIISLTNNYFNYILKGLNIGYILPDMDSLISVVLDIINSDRKSEQDYDFDLFAERTSIKHIGERMKVQLEEKSLI